MISKNSIDSYLDRSLRAVIFVSAARGALRAAPCLALFWPVAWLDAVAPLLFWQRALVWFVVVIGAALAFASGFWPFTLFSLRARSRRLSERSRETVSEGTGFRTDDLRIAAEFSKNIPAGTSSDLGAAFVERVTEELRRRPARWTAPAWSWRGPVSMNASLLVLITALTVALPTAYRPGLRVLLPFVGREIERRVTVSPGDATVPWGEDAEITLTLTAPSADRPDLEIRTASGWTVAEPRTEDARARTYAIKNVVEPLPYRVLWRGERGRRFTLTPSSPIQITAFAITVRPPDYTGQSSQTQDAPEISGLPGTQVALTAHTSAPLASVAMRFSDGRERAVDSVADAAFTVHFSVDKTMTYRFVLTATDGRSAVTGEYPIKAEEDAPPTIVLVSPDQDLVVGDKEKIPLTYEARDDRGVAEVALLWGTTDGPSHRDVIARPAPGTDGGLSTYNWDLALLHAQPGQVIRFRLEAVDRNTVTGPGRATTEWRLIEIAGFEREHAALDRALAAWRDATVEALARMNTLEAKLAAPNADPSALMQPMAQSAADLNALQSALDSIVKRMEKDPLADYGSWMEHRAMAESLSALSQGAMKEAQSALQTGNKSAAQARVQDVSAELERMSALSEDLSKAQRASDLVDAGDKLKDLGQDLVKELSDGKLDAATKQRVNDLLSEAQKKLAEMARSLQQMPQDLPDDFVNQEGVKNIPIGQTQDIMKKIADAMARGDGAEALKLAQDFLSSVNKMSERLNKANDEFTSKNSASELAKKVDEEKEKLEKITDEQRALLAETQKIESERMKERLKEQEKLLAQLYERQEKVVAAARDALQTPGWPGANAVLFSRMLAPMQLVAEEFKRGRVEQSPTLLTTIVMGLEPVAASFSASSATGGLGPVVTKIKSEEADILKELQKSSSPSDSTGGEESGASMPDLSRRQSDLAHQTQSLKQELQTLSRKTASLGVPLTDPLSHAGTAMEGAAGHLQGGRSGSARSAQEEALSDLLQGQSEMEQAQSAMGDMASQQGGGSGGSGSGGGPRMMIRSGGPGGSQGMRNGKVRLPTAEDYRPPKAFREDLLESLKENYPKVYEEIIRKYYKRLAD